MPFRKERIIPATPLCIPDECSPSIIFDQAIDQCKRCLTKLNEVEIGQTEDNSVKQSITKPQRQTKSI